MIDLHVDEDGVEIVVEEDNAYEKAKELLDPVNPPDDAGYVHMTISRKPQMPPVGEAGVAPEGAPTSERWNYVLDAMRRRPDEWWHTPQVRNHLPENAPIENGEVSKVLYQLAESGYVDKKPSETDERMNRYKLTSKGMEMEEAETA